MMHDDTAKVMRQTRLAMAPAPGDPDATHKQCDDCGEWFWDWTTKWRRYCADCGADRSTRQRAETSARARAARRID